MSDSQVELFPVAAGDVLHLGGGLSWRVVDRDSTHLSFVVEGLEEEPTTRRVSLRQWKRVAERSEAGRST